MQDIELMSDTWHSKTLSLGLIESSAPLLFSRRSQPKGYVVAEFVDAIRSTISPSSTVAAWLLNFTSWSTGSLAVIECLCHHWKSDQPVIPVIPATVQALTWSTYTISCGSFSVIDQSGITFYPGYSESPRYIGLVSTTSSLPHNQW